MRYIQLFNNNSTLRGACIGGMGGALASIGVPPTVIGAVSGVVSSVTNQYAENKDISSPEAIAQDFSNAVIGLGFGALAQCISDTFMITDTFWVTESQANVNNAFFIFVTDGLLGVTSSLYADASDQTISTISKFYETFGQQAVSIQNQLE